MLIPAIGTAAYQAWRSGKPAPADKRERGPSGRRQKSEGARLRLLRMLTKARGEFVSVNAILAGVYGDDLPKFPLVAVRGAVRELRNTDGYEIASVRGKGYRLLGFRR